MPGPSNKPQNPHVLVTFLKDHANHRDAWQSEPKAAIEAFLQRNGDMEWHTQSEVVPCEARHFRTLLEHVMRGRNPAPGLPLGGRSKCLLALGEEALHTDYLQKIGYIKSDEQLQQLRKAHSKRLLEWTSDSELQRGTTRSGERLEAADSRSSSLSSANSIYDVRGASDTPPTGKQKQHTSRTVARGKSSSSCANTSAHSRGSRPTPGRKVSSHKEHPPTTASSRHSLQTPKGKIDVAFFGKEMQHLCSLLESISQQAFVSLANLMGTEPHCFCLSPSPGLGELYQLLLGDSRNDHCMSFVNKAMPPSEVCSCLLGAFIHCRIFSQEFDYELAPMAEAARQAMGEFYEPFCQVLEKKGVDMPDVIRTMHSNFVNQEPGQTKMKQLASSLRWELLSLMGEHIGAQRNAIEVLGSCSRVQKMLALLYDKVFGLLQDAIRLKCTVSAAEERLKFLWAGAGESFEIHSMRSSNDPLEKVALAIFSGLALENMDGIHNIAKLYVVTRGMEG